MTKTKTKDVGAKAIGEEVRDAIESGGWEGLHFTMPQLDAKLYQKVKKVMEACGGKWNRKAAAIIFEDEDAKASMIAAGETGTYIDLKKAFQQFDTPELVVEDLIEKLDIPSDKDLTLRFLEPSAGLGNMIGPLMDIESAESMNFQIIAVELDPKRVKHLKTELTCNIVNEGDFLDVTLEDIDGAVDYVIMNPPFTRGQDIDHVLHAFEFLKPGGKLIAIMAPGWRFYGTKKADAFRNFVKENGEQHDRGGENYGYLPEGTFKASGTNIKTTWVLLQKPNDSKTS